MAIDLRPIDMVNHAIQRVTGHTVANGCALCPAHEADGRRHRPSLSVTESADGKVLLHCHRGCDIDTILGALDLTAADLAPHTGNGNGSGGGNEPIATYPYRDETGKLLYEVLRFEGKQFRQRKPLPGGGWEWSIKDVRRVPYRLPELIAAVAAGKPVLVVEGEKDAHAVEWAGGVATCNSGGAGKWQPEFADHLVGARVVIVRDQDPPGMKHAADVEASLSGKARKVIVVDPAEGKDAADHLVAGHTLGEWFALLDPVALDRVDIGELMRVGVPKPTLVHSWLYEGALHTIQSEPGVGKSWVALWIAAQLIDAGIAVVYLDEEGGPELTTERLLALGVDPAGVSERLWYHPFPGRRWNDDDVDALGGVLAAAGRATNGVGLVVLDSLPDFLSLADLSEDSSRDVTEFVHRILTPVRAHGAALLVLDHLRKPDQADDSKTTGRKKKGRYARGSGAKLAKAALTISLDAEEPFNRHRSGTLKLWKTKDRRGAIRLPERDEPPLVLRVVVADDGRSVKIVEAGPEEPSAPASEPWHGPTRAMESCGAWLQAHPGEQFGINTIRDSIVDFTTRKGFRRETVKDALECLAGNRTSGVRCVGGPRGSTFFAWYESTAVSDETGDDNESF